MSVNPEIRRELSDLLGRLRDGQSDAADLARLDAMVSGDPAVCALPGLREPVCIAPLGPCGSGRLAERRGAAQPRGAEGVVRRGGRGPRLGFRVLPIGRSVARSGFGGCSPTSEQSRRFLRAAVVPRQRPPLLSGSRDDLWVRQPRRLEMECRRPGSGIRPARRCSLTGDGNDGGSNSCRPSDANGRLPTGQRERGAGWRGGRLGPEVFVGLRRAGNRLCQRTDGHAPRPCHVRGGLADRRLPPRRQAKLPRGGELRRGSTGLLCSHAAPVKSQSPSFRRQQRHRFRPHGQPLGGGSRTDSDSARITALSGSPR